MIYLYASCVCVSAVVSATAFIPYSNFFVIFDYRYADPSSEFQSIKVIRNAKFVVVCDLVYAIYAIDSH